MDNVQKLLNEFLINQYNDDLIRKIFDGYNINRKTTVRVNSIKANLKDIELILEQNKIIFNHVPWYNDALIIENVDEEKIRSLDIYKKGQIYLQSLSSMLPPLVLSPKSRESILDMAAAPGSKTTELSALSNNEALIMAVEKNKIRADRLRHNLDSQGAKKVNVLEADARNLDDMFKFDKILLDAPCSGSGTINLNDKNIEKYFTRELVERSSKTQKELINKAINLLKVNGELVYSTCSIFKCENEDVVNFVLKNSNIELVSIDESLFKDIPLLPVSIDGTICVCPNEFYEGFFVAKFRKIR